MNDPVRPAQDNRAIAESVARGFFRIDLKETTWERAAAQYLLGALESAVLIPQIFEQRYGEIGPLGWGTTIFFVVYCLLAAIGLFFIPRTQFHTTVPLRGDWLDHVGAFWLVACAFGPFLGWICTSALPITAGSWRWVYGARVFLAAGLPVVTAIPLTRYVRGKAAWVSLPMLIGVTILPILSAVGTSQDLRDGPRSAASATGGEPRLILAHTGRSLGLANRVQGTGQHFGLAGVFDSMGVCLSLDDSSRASGDSVILVLPPPRGGRGGAEVVRAVIGARAGRCPVPLQQLGAATYRVRAADGLEPGQPYVAIVGPVGRLVRDSASARFAMNGGSVSVRECASTEGIHFTVWRTQGQRSTRIWHRYYYAGYDMEPDCTDQEVAP